MPSLDDMTSTGAKFWHHPDQMQAYKDGTGKSVITTHISPEGACNLTCSYCSVSKRDTHSRLSLDDIFVYLNALQPRGLKAVILTGGGEPMAYPYFGYVVSVIHSRELKIGLITNGTLSHRLDSHHWGYFDWVRVSINTFPGWQQKIKIPDIPGTVGLSYCYHKDEDVWDDILRKADELKAEYIRVLPDCTLPQKELIEWHQKLDAVLPNDKRFIHQPKLHAAPQSSICHQSYFRPYLHESGLVYPCDSVVLNDSPGKFIGKYALCKAADIGQYLDRKTEHGFNPIHDCSGCVFTGTVNMLEDYVKGRVVREATAVQDPDFV